jgi:hypothetical protein
MLLFDTNFRIGVKKSRLFLRTESELIENNRKSILIAFPICQYNINFYPHKTPYYAEEIDFQSSHFSKMFHGSHTVTSLNWLTAYNLNFNECSVMSTVFIKMSALLPLYDYSQVNALLYFYVLTSNVLVLFADYRYGRNLCRVI